MKKSFTLIVLLAWALRCLCQPQFDSTPVFPSSVNLFDLFEVSFTLGDTYSNPYDPDTISITATFFSPDAKTYIVNAFYYEGYSFFYYDGYENYNSTNNNGWRIRFTPNCVGTWRFHLQARDRNGITTMPYTGIRNYTFVCNSVSNANGFISKANSRYLKRDVVRNGQRRYHSFFPIGPNIAWYSCVPYDDYSHPTGIYYYQRYIDSLSNNANYMRIFINRFQCLSLFGPEYTQEENGNPVVYFNNTVNQKDSAELDQIINYALQHNVSLMISIFTCETFRDRNAESNSPSNWNNNPFHTILELSNACDFFTDSDAKKITKNLIRYIVSRWGYATNVMNWELWNEVDHVFYMCDGYKRIEQDVLEWHEEMTDFIREIDPFGHCISSSIGNVVYHPYLNSVLYNNLDFVQQHNYQNIQNAESRHQLSYILYNKVDGGHNTYPSKPFFMAEFGFDQRTSPYYAEKDPYGIDLHNSLWSTLFSSSMGPASFWYWSYLNSCGLFKRFSPLLRFCENLPILSDSFTASLTGSISGHELVFTNELQTYYIANANQDTIYGWAQDTVFAYQSLRWLTDSAHYVPTDWGPVLRFKADGVFDPLGYVYTLNQEKKPGPSSNNNTIIIPITNQSVGSRYLIRWYDAETGNAINNGYISYTFVNQNAQGDKYVSLTIPSQISNLQQQVINNKFGDVVFSLTLNNLPH